MIRSNKHRIVAFILIFVTFIGLVVCATKIDTAKKYEDVAENEFKVEINIVLPEKVYVANEAVVEWMNGTDTAIDIFNKYRQYGRLDYTKPVELLYTVENLPLDCQVLTQYITVTDKDYSIEVFSQKLPAEERTVNIENLRPDTNYEVVIQVIFSNGRQVEKSYAFKTEPSPCFLFVDGVRNLRDIGTAKTVDGRQVKKYMLYRGAEIDGAMEPRYKITENGIDYMLNVLNIKTEIDLRWYEEDVMSDILGPKVTHNYYSMSAYNDFFDTDHSVENAKELFSALAKPDAYPLYIHCSYGADRTGTIIYVLEALLGVNEETMYQEWESSVICNGEGFYEEMDAFLVRFKSLEGNTMKEKAENYLLSIGVTKQEIESIREILLTD